MKRYLVKVEFDGATVEIQAKNRRKAMETAAHELNNNTDAIIHIIKIK